MTTLGRLIRAIAAIPLILGGLFFAFLPFGFATMLDGEPDHPMSWGEYLGAVCSRGAGSFAVGGAMLAFGVMLITPPRCPVGPRP